MLVAVELPFAVILDWSDEIVEVSVLPTSAVKSTVAVCVAGVPLIEKLSVAVVTVVVLVKVAVYVPSSLSVTEPIVPALVEIDTVPALPVRLVPPAVSNCTVIVDVDTPSAGMLVGSAEMVEVTVLPTVAMKLTVAVWVAGVPLIEKLSVAVETVLELVKVAVYVPSPLSVTVPKLPALVPIVTVPPLVIRSAPPADFN